MINKMFPKAFIFSIPAIRYSVWVAAMLLFCSKSNAQTSSLTPEKLWQLGRVALEDVSPDGKTTVYGVTRYNLAANKGNTDLYVIDNESDVPTARRVTAFEGSEYNARFRADGKKIGFLRDGFLWEMNPDGSDQQQASDLEMNGFIYSPTGDKILFAQDVKYRKTTKETYPDLPMANARIYDDLLYRHWKNWDDQSESNVFFAEYKDGKIVGAPQNIIGEAFEVPLEPDEGMEQIAWSADGKFIAYSCKKLRGKEYATSTNTDIFLYELATAKTTNLSEGMKGYDKEPIFSPDGKYLVWTSMERAGFEADRTRLFSYNLQTRKREELTVGFDNDVAAPKWSADSKIIYFVGGDNGTHPLFGLNFLSKKITQLTSGIHDYVAFGLGAAGKLIAQRQSMSMPSELYSVEIKNGSAKQITSTNKALMSQIKIGEVRKKVIKTTDGKEMLVWMILPPDFDAKKKYPTLLYCQGGPQSALSQFWSYRWNFQLMANNGYVVVAPCRRGMPTFGRKWNDDISKDWGGQPMRDYLSAIDDAKKEPFVDADRLGAVGASYGGYSVYWLAGNHEKRFKCFISHCGLFNLESWYGTTEELFFANHDIGGAYWDKPTPESYSKFSPHNFVGNWDAPILVIHGERDFRVPLQEGMQAFQAARLKGIPARFLTFPDEGHWVSSPQNSVLWQREYFAWLEKWLKK